MSVLKDLTDRAEKVKAKILTPAENRISDHQDIPISVHFAAYLTKLEAEETSPGHRRNVARTSSQRATVLESYRKRLPAVSSG